MMLHIITGTKYLLLHLLWLAGYVFQCNFDNDDCPNSINVNIGGNNIVSWTRTTGETPSSDTGPTDGNGGMLLTDFVYQFN